MCAEQFVPSRQIAAAIAGCVSFGAERCIAASAPSQFLSPILPSAIAASSWSGPSSLEISTSVGDGFGDPVVADRLDHRAAEEVDAAPRIADEHRGNAGLFVNRRQRADQRRPHEFAFFLVERGEHLRRHRRPRVLLEIREGHFAEAIVRRGHRRFHDVQRSADR